MRRRIQNNLLNSVETRLVKMYLDIDKRPLSKNHLDSGKDNIVFFKDGPPNGEPNYFRKS